MDSWRIDQDHLSDGLALLVLYVNDALNAITRGLWLVSYDGQLLTHQRVEQCGFPGIRPPDNRNKTGSKGHQLLSLRTAVAGGCSLAGGLRFGRLRRTHAQSLDSTIG